MSIILIMFVLLAMSLVFAKSAFAVTTVPTTMNFQGRVTNSSGNILADGLYNMKFRIYDASTSGTLKWSETRETTNRVQVTNGLFSVQLGQVNPIDSSIFASGSLYFEIELPTPGTATCSTSSCQTWTEGPMTPRNKLSTSAYAYNSETLDGIDSAQFARNDQANVFAGAQTVRADSTTAFQVQDASGTSTFLTADTTNSRLVVKAGALQQLSSELFTSFSTCSGAGWTVSGETASYSNTEWDVLNCSSPTVTPGATYQITFTISDSSGPATGDNNVEPGIGDSGYDDFTGNGVHSYTVTAADDYNLEFWAGPDFNGTISNVSVKEVTYLDKPVLVVKDADDNVTLEVRSSVNNTVIGLDAGKSLTQGIHNTALGIQALESTTDGINNTAIGSYSLQSNLSGSNNSAIGAGSLQNNTSGSWNAALGFNSLYSNTNGFSNVAVGGRSLFGNTSGYANTAIGTQSLESNTSGIYNTAVGYVSLQSNTTGTYNTAVGTEALNKNTTGNENTAVGSRSLKNNTTGTGNVATGGGTLASNTTGNENTAIGYSTLGNNTTGNGNTGVGSQALGLNTTGTFNTAQGYNSLFSNTSGSNNAAFGSGSLQQNTVGGNNAALGNASLGANTSGSNNAAVGGSSLSNNTTGDQNAGLGSTSLFWNTTGAYNTALGYFGLGANTTGNYNSALGIYAGYSDSGSHFKTLADLQKATAIGAYAQVQKDNTIVLGSVDDNTQVVVGATVPVGTNRFGVSPLDYQAGTATRTNSSTTLTGTGTTWTSAMVGDIIVFADGTTNTVAGFTDGTTITMGAAYAGTTDSNPVYYRFHKPGFQVTNSGDTYVANTSATAFKVVDAAGATAVLTANTSSYNVQIGSATTDGTAVALVLDSYNNGTDPSGTNGSMYYNSNTNKFRCYQNGAWTDCVGSGGGGVTTVGTYSGTSIANGASISGSTLTLGVADGTNPGMVSTTTQTFAGAKTFSSATKVETTSTTAFQVNAAGGASVLNVDTTGKKVGIGTSAPSAKLDVDATAGSLGSELVTNGTFTGSATGWTLGDCASYGSNAVSAMYTSCDDPNVSTSIATVSGKIYKLTFDMTTNGDSAYPYVDNSRIPLLEELTDGSHTFYFRSTYTGSESLFFESWDWDDDTGWSIDNVSVKEIDMPVGFSVTGYDGTVWLSTGNDVDYNTAMGQQTLSTNSGLYNNAFGTKALAVNTTGWNNSAFGALALASNTTGSGNIAMGREALKSNISGNANIAIGVSALKNNTGSYNTAVGNGALNQNTTGQYNTGIGYFSMVGNTTGNFNTALGSQALQGNQTGSYNVAFGQAALLYNTQGSGNAALGTSALMNNTGDYNSAVGNSALLSNTSGINNSAVGRNALYGNTSGNQNAGLGQDALRSNTTGSSNTALGFRAGYQDSNNYFATLGNLQGSTAIGAYAQVQANNTISIGSVDQSTQVVVGSTVPIGTNIFGVSPVGINSGSITATQSGTTVTSSGAIFGSVNIGDRLVWADGSTNVITDYLDGGGTQVAVQYSGTRSTPSSFRTHKVGLQVKNTGETYVESTSTAAFRIQKAGATESLFVANTTNNQIKIGNDTSTTGLDVAVLVLDNAPTTNTPTGVAGAMFYDSSIGKFKCYTTSWVDCDTTGSGVTTVGTFAGSSTANGASISGSTITFAPADGTNPGMVSTTTQTFAGDKTHTGSLIAKASNNASAFKVQNGNADVMLNVDTTSYKVQIGSTTTDANVVLFGLDSYNSGTDPTGVAGAMYYNTNLNKYRCYENGSWKNCITTDTDTGVTAVGTFAGASIANGASISGSTITFGAADATSPGMVTTGAQTFGGAKTFNLGSSSTAFKVGNGTTQIIEAGYTGSSESYLNLNYVNGLYADGGDNGLQMYGGTSYQYAEDDAEISTNNFIVSSFGGTKALDLDNISGDVTLGTIGSFDVPTKLANPANQPPGTATSTSWSNDSIYLAATSTSSPYFTIYKRSGNTLTKLSDPASMPGASTDGAAFSPDGQYLSIALTSSPYINIYKRSGDTFTKLSNPATLPAGVGSKTAWSGDGQYLAISHASSPFVTVYKRSGDTFTKIANPATLPQDNGTSVSWSPDGQYMIVTYSNSSPWFTVYKRTGDTLTKLAYPASAPAGNASHSAWSPDGQYLTLGLSVSPYIATYKRSGDTFTKLSDPATAPTGSVKGISWSPDGQYMVANHFTSPYVTFYKRSGDTFTKQTDPADLPGSNASGSSSWSSDGRFLAIPNASATSLIIYGQDSGLTLNTTLNGSVFASGDANAKNITSTGLLKSQNGLLVAGTSTLAGDVTLSDGVFTATSSSVVFKNATDSTTAFQVQNAAGTTTVLGVDTANQRVGIGVTPSSARLEIGYGAMGSELVTNGTFTGSATGWTMGSGGCATYGSNAATVLYDGGVCDANVSTSVSLVSGKHYKIEFDIITNGDAPYFYFSNNSAGSNQLETGHHSFSFTADDTSTDTLWFESWNWDDNTGWTIDNVTLKEISTADPPLAVSGFDGAPWLTLYSENPSYSGNLYSTAFGQQTLTVNTGENNTAMGAFSLRNNTTGSENTALGTRSLESNTTGRYSVAVGALSLQGNTTGGYNSALGMGTLQMNTSGGENTAVGYYSLQGNTTGYNNTGIGARTLTSNTTGDYNTALGSYGLSKNTTGSGNTAVGNSALYNNTTGDNNVGIGPGAMSSNTSGSNNISIGSSALFSNTTGMRNIAIGYEAGYQDANATFSTGSNIQQAVAIGAWAQVQESNTIVLGSVDNPTRVVVGATVPSNSSTFAVTPIRYQTGTASRTASSYTVVGTGTSWTSAMVGDMIVFSDGAHATVTNVTDATHLSMAVGSSVTDSTPVAYRLHYRSLEVYQNGDVMIGVTSTTALQIQKPGVTIFTGDTTNNRVKIGDSDHYSNADVTVLVLDTTPSTYTPTGVAGAMYYDSTNNKFKCYTTSWVDCDTTGGGSGVTTVGAFAGASIANGASISGTTITFGKADGTNPGLVSTDAQTFAGAKTFTSKLTANDIEVSAGKTLKIIGDTRTNINGITPAEGMLNYDTTNKQLLVYANGKWQGDRVTSTKIVAASNSPQMLKDAADYVADGTADQSEINSALTAAAGGRVYLAEGTYTINAAISVPNNTTLAGAGIGTIITIPNTLNSTFNLIQNSNNGLVTGNKGILIRDLKIDGNDTNNTGTQTAISLLANGSSTTNIADASVKDVTIYNITAGITSEAYQSTYSGNRFDTVGGAAMAFSWGGRSVITDNTFKTVTSNPAIYVYNSNNNTVTGNTIESAGIGVSLSFASNNTITGNAVRTPSDKGIALSASHSNTVTSNSITSATNYGIYIDSSNTNTITSNNVVDSGGSTTNNGIYLTTADSNTIASNTITDGTHSSDNYAINVFNSGSDTNQLSTNSLGGGTVNDSGTGTVYANQQNGSAALVNSASTVKSTSSTAFVVQDAGNAALLTADTSSKQVVVTSGSTDAVLGSSLIATASGTQPFNTSWTATNWTTAANTAAHTTGNTSALTSSWTPTIGVTYQVSYTYNSCSAANTLTVTMGGQTLETGTSCVGTNTKVVTATSTAGLSFQPSTNYAGTVSSVTVKALTTQVGSAFTVKNSSSVATLEVRSSGSSSNLFIGVNSGMNNTSAATGNTAVGANTLQNTTTGGTNSAFGNNSLMNNTTGGGNTASGNNSLMNNTTGSNNTATGNNALMNSITGGYNTASGAYALYNNTSGNYNVAVGLSSLNNNTSGGNNAALGNAALYFNTTGTYNAALGNESLNSITTGSYNSGVGHYAGYQDSAGGFKTTADIQRATAIGAFAQVQKNNTIALGSVDDATQVIVGATVPISTNRFGVSPLDYQIGNAIRTNSSATLTGSGTTWTSAMVGDIIIFADGTTNTVAGFTDATTITMGTTYTGTTDGFAKPYRFHKPGFQVTNTGDTYVANTSTTAFKVQNAGASEVLFTANTSSNQVKIGNSTAAANADVTILVLDNAVSTYTPTGAAGGMFFDSTNNRFKCYTTTWVNCDTDTDTDTDTGVTSVATFSGSSIANGASISGTSITFGPADGTNPGMVTTGAQTLAGAKTFTGNMLIQPGADADNVFEVKRNNGTTDVLTVDTETTTDPLEVQIGSNSSIDTTQINLALDSSSAFADSGTCGTSTNQGSLYYNTNTNAIRGCVQGAWEDVMTTAGMGLLTFGIVPDSGSGAGDIMGITGATNGPCKVSWATSTTVTIVQGCTVYSGGRKVVIANNTTPTGSITFSNNNFVHVCLTGTGNQPAFSSSGAEGANLPTFSTNAPIVCLADIKTTNTAIANIYDTRTFTTTTKQFATINATTAFNGMVVTQSGTAGLVQIPTAAAQINTRGIVVASAGTAASNNTINLILATQGIQPVKASGTSAVNSYVQAATTGYTTTATLSANAYGNVGIALRTIDTACNATTNCQYSQIVDMKPR